MAAIPDRKVTPPVQNPETTHFWNAANEGRLLLRRCTACNKPHFYPRTLCPFCLGQTNWEDASGNGTIYTYSVMRHTEQPYVIAYVKLDEGPTMMTNIVDCPQTPEALQLDMPLEVSFSKQSDDISLPLFAPAK